MASERYEVAAAASFEEDLAVATSYMVERGGASAARRFLDRYAELRLLLGVFPGHGSPVGADGLRWRELSPFTAVYEYSDATHTVTLLRLHYRSSNWREGLEAE